MLHTNDPGYRGEYQATQMSNAEYHSVGLPWCSAHRLAMFSQWGPATVTHEVECPAQPSAAMVLGSAMHSKILTPDLFNKEFRVWKGDRRTKAGKEEYAQLQLNSQGAEILNAEQEHQVNGMRDAVMQHSTLGRMVERAVKHGNTERSLFYEYADVPCKARIDAMCMMDNGEVALLDLKTTSRSMAVDDLVRTCANYGYVEQLAFYSAMCREAGIGHSRVLIGFVGSKAPYPVRVCELTPDWLQAATQVNLLRLCMWKNADWDCPEDNEEPIADLEMPAWYGNSIQ